MLSHPKDKLNLLNKTTETPLMRESWRQQYLVSLNNFYGSHPAMLNSHCKACSYRKKKKMKTMYEILFRKNSKIKGVY